MVLIVFLSNSTGSTKEEKIQVRVTHVYELAWCSLQKFKHSGEDIIHSTKFKPLRQ